MPHNSFEALSPYEAYTEHMPMYMPNKVRRGAYHTLSHIINTNRLKVNQPCTIDYVIQRASKRCVEKTVRGTFHAFHYAEGAHTLLLNQSDNTIFTLVFKDKDRKCGCRYCKYSDRVTAVETHIEPKVDPKYCVVYYIPKEVVTPNILIGMNQTEISAISTMIEGRVVQRACIYTGILIVYYEVFNEKTGETTFITFKEVYANIRFECYHSRFQCARHNVAVPF